MPHPKNLVNSGLEATENGWRVYAHPLNFRIGRLPALPHGRYVTDSRQTAKCYVVAQAYSPEQQNAGRAHVELCHASS